MNNSEKLARQWMTGTRQGSGNRPAWMHPQDLVNLLQELKSAHPNVLPGEAFDDAVSIAWGHDLIEDGKKPDGSSVSWGDLVEGGLSPYVADCISKLSQPKDVEKEAYLKTLFRALGSMTALVKVVDRICNLREGKDTFKPARWARYVKETNDYIVPLLNLVPNPARDWLRERLEAARDARPVEG